MLKKLAELKVNTNVDYHNEIVKTLEEKGFTVILEVKTSFENHYSIAKEDGNTE